MSTDGRRFAPGETVHLLTELREGPRIHEIGTRAHVLEDHGAVVVLHLYGSEAEVVTCPSDRVVRAAERDARVRGSRRSAALHPATA